MGLFPENRESFCSSCHSEQSHCAVRHVGLKDYSCANFQELTQHNFQHMRTTFAANMGNLGELQNQPNKMLLSRLLRMCDLLRCRCGQRHVSMSALVTARIQVADLQTNKHVIIEEAEESGNATWLDLQFEQFAANKNVRLSEARCFAC